MLRIMMIVVALGSAMLFPSGIAATAAKTTIALTASRNAGAEEANHKLTESLIAL